MSSRRVVVTGLGLISPVGNSVAEGWSHVRDGVSGITPIDQMDVSAFTTRFAGTVRNFDVTQYLEPKEARKCDPFMHYGIAASVQAIKDAGIEITEANAVGERMTIPGSLLGVIFMALLVAPSLLRMFGST